MAFLLIHSCECLKSELVLFDIPPTQTTIEDSHWVQYKPISSLADDSLIEFVIPVNSDEYIDLAHTMLSLHVSLKCTIAEEDVQEGDLAAFRALTNQVGPINNLMHSLFNQMDVLFNQKPVSPPTNAYAYRA